MSSPILISLPRSKSIVIRCLIVNYLKNKTLLSIFENDPNDIKVVYNALKIIDSQTKTPVAKECVVDVQDCGAAYRFLMAVLAVTKGKWILTGTPHLLQRPILPLVNFLNAKGAKIERIELGWCIEGTALKIDDFEIDTSETSQYVSAVMILGVPEGRGSLYVNPYIRMTEAILKTQNLPTSRILALADWSAAVFWIANALLVPNAHYLLKDLHFDGLQGDAKIVPWFEKWGLHFVENKNGIEVKHIHSVKIFKQKIDVAQTPDIAMTLGVLSVCYPFELTMSGLKNLNLKESNRLDILVNELSKFTKIKKHSNDVITIHKRKEALPKQFHFDSYNDHRFVMAWSLFINFGMLEVDNSECVRKSYPEFIETLRSFLFLLLPEAKKENPVKWRFPLFRN